MAKPKIRHLALFARDPDKLAEFYRDVFDMELVYSKGPGQSKFLTDGHLTLAILAHKLEGSAPVGLNHFGFSVDDTDERCKRIVNKGLEEPKERPADRTYAELRAIDPEGNWFDLSSSFEELRDEYQQHLAGTAAKP